jgi:hypothetical protein
MKRPGLFLLLLLAPLLLAGCPPPSYMTVFNNTGEAIEVSTERGHISIARNQFDQFRDPVNADEVFRLTAGRCEYLYDFSMRVVDYDIDRALARGLQIQAEKDFSISLVSGSYAGGMPVSGDTILTRKGFPLHPVSRKCR